MTKPDLTRAGVIGDDPSAILRFWKRAAERHLARAETAEQRVATLEAEVEKWKQAFAAQSRKLQSVLHIEGVRAALKGDAHGLG